VKLVCLLIYLATVNAFAAKLSEPVVFTGTCDASAAIALSGDLFLVANDEDNLLRFYRFSRPGSPVQTFDLKPLFSTKRKASEVDLEGAVRLGDLVFFVSSHGRNSAGKPAPARQRFFALALAETNGTTTINSVGQTYTNLVVDLARHPEYRRFDLDDAAGLAPKAPGGFNIEALAATPEGTLLIGFRSPIPQGRALIATLRNPQAVITGKPPEFGPPLLLDLGGLGLRDMCATADGFYLVAGPAAGDAESRLYFWAGSNNQPRCLNELRFPKSNPEAICYLDFGTGADYLILSDDGTRKINGKECKTLPEAQRQFRAYRFAPEKGDSLQSK
jgi:hypothetical protein